MHARLRTGVAEMVRAALLADDLDAAVRDLALERLEARLLDGARAELGDRVHTATLDAAEGVVRFEGDVDGEATAPLLARVERVLVLQLAPCVGEARVAVKRGEGVAPRASTMQPTPEVTASWPDVVAALLAVVAAQQRRLDALEEALTRGATALREGRETAKELRHIEALVAALQRDGG